MRFTPEQIIVVHGLVAKFGWLLLVILIDLILGVTVALKQRAFRWDKLADFIADYGPKLLAWLALELLNFLPPELKQVAGLGETLAVGAYALIMVSAMASVLGHVQAVGLALPIPGVPPTGSKQ